MGLPMVAKRFVFGMANCGWDSIRERVVEMGRNLDLGPAVFEKQFASAKREAEAEDGAM